MYEASTVAATTLGCKVNLYDTEAMLSIFKDKGYIIGEFDEYADIYIINTCTVTNLGDRKSRQMIRRARKNNPNAIIIATGCYAQLAPEEIGRIEGVNIIIGTKDRSSIVELVEAYDRTQGVVSIVGDIMKDKEYERLKVQELKGRTRAYLKIQEGCEQFCAYCIIPYVRGRVKSRTLDDIMEEALRFGENGFKEIVLAGIHVASYGKDLGNTGLVELIREVHKIDGIKRIRLSSIDPNAIDSSFLSMVGDCEKVCSHFHLSLQSGCDRTLARMNRKYTTSKYKEAIENLKALRKDIAFTTDVIVGFPGEIDADFIETCNFCEDIGFSKLHIFPYSPKKGSKAAEFTGQISSIVKETRAKKLKAIDEELSNAFLKSLIGKETPVLFERKTDEGYYVGHTDNYAEVFTKTEGDDITNEIKTISIKRIEKGILFGE